MNTHATAVSQHRAAFVDPDIEATFTRQGYVVVPFLTAEEIRRVEEIYWEVGPAPDDPRLSIHFDFQSQDSDYKRAVRRALLPVLSGAAAALLDRYRIFSPTFIMKWPGARSGFAPHQDASVVDERTHRSLSIWCPLVDVPSPGGHDNGILRFVPGSHEFVSWIRAHDPKGFAFAGHEPAIIDQFSVEVPVRAGHAIVFDHRVVHFSMPNEGAQPRLVVALGMVPDEAPLLHYRRVADDEFEIYEIDDDYYVDLSPQQVASGLTAYQLVGTTRAATPGLSGKEFKQACRRSGGGRFRHLLRRRRGVTAINAAPFCFRCGTESGLVGDPASFQDGNVVHLCVACTDQQLR